MFDHLSVSNMLMNGGFYTSNGMSWDYMTVNPNNMIDMQYNFSALNPYFSPYFCLYETVPMDNTSDTSLNKNHNSEYTPIYATDKILKSTKKSKEDVNCMKYYGFGAGIAAGTAGLVYLGKRAVKILGAGINFIKKIRFR